MVCYQLAARPANACNLPARREARLIKNVAPEPVVCLRPTNARHETSMTNADASPIPIPAVGGIKSFEEAVSFPQVLTQCRHPATLEPGLRASISVCFAASPIISALRSSIVFMASISIDSPRLRKTCWSCTRRRRHAQVLGAMWWRS